MAQPPAPPKVFISYAREEEPHPTWVKELAIRLRTKDGLDVTLDIWDARPGDELTLFMEQSVRDSRFVILICTPGYKAKFDARLGGVGYEATGITGEILNGPAKRKVIPVHRSGTWAEAAPMIVAGCFHINLTGDPFKEPEYRALVDTLRGKREIAPLIGRGDTLFEGPSAAPATAVADFSGRDEELRSLLSHLRAPDGCRRRDRRSFEPWPRVQERRARRSWPRSRGSPPPRVRMPSTTWQGCRWPSFVRGRPARGDCTTWCGCLCARSRKAETRRPRFWPGCRST